MHEEGCPSVPVKTYPVAKDLIFIESLHLLPILCTGIFSPALVFSRLYSSKYFKLFLFGRLFTMTVLVFMPYILKKVIDSAKPAPKPTTPKELQQYRDTCFKIALVVTIFCAIAVLLPEGNIIAVICAIVGLCITNCIEIAIWIMLLKYCFLTRKKR